MLDRMVIGKMEWRGIDNLIASSCIQQIQKEINAGKKKASDFIPILMWDEKKSKEVFNAWRVYFIDRMGKEYDEQGWNKYSVGGEKDFEDMQHDIDYYNALVEEEQSKRNKK